MYWSDISQTLWIFNVCSFQKSLYNTFNVAHLRALIFLLCICLNHLCLQIFILTLCGCFWDTKGNFFLFSPCEMCRDCVYFCFAQIRLAWRKAVVGLLPPTDVAGTLQLWHKWRSGCCEISLLYITAIFACFCHKQINGSGFCHFNRGYTYKYLE